VIEQCIDEYMPMYVRGELRQTPREPLIRMSAESLFMGAAGVEDTLVKSFGWKGPGMILFGAALTILGMFCRSEVPYSRLTIFGIMIAGLPQHHDELPKLVGTCKAYMAHESGRLDVSSSSRRPRRRQLGF